MKNVRQAFRLPNRGLAANAIVEITSCEDRGEFYYISYVPVKWLDGKMINQDQGLFGAIKIKKTGEKPQRLKIFVRDTPSYGIGQRAAFSMA